MSKIVILAINAKYIHTSLAAWILAANFSKNPHSQVEVVEANINQSAQDIAALVLGFKPDIVAISCYIWNAQMLPEIIRLLCGTTIILGGPEASYNAQYWLTQGADYVVKGDCDDTIDPYTDAYFERLNGRLAYIETSRGCPFSCSFCLSGRGDHAVTPSVKGGRVNKVKFFELDKIKEQIKKLSDSTAKTIKFVDRTFNCNAERAYELFEFVIGLDTCKCFHFEVAADLFNQRTLALLANAPAGRIQLETGIQSLHEPALKAVSRFTDIKKTTENIRLLMLNNNIHVHVDLIAGLPYETLADFRSGFDKVFELGAHTLQLGFLKLLHGSVLRKQAEELGIIYNTSPPYEIKSSPWLSTEDLQVLKCTENALQHTRNKKRFLSCLEYVLSVTRISPFDLFRELGETVQAHNIELRDYAAEIYGYFIKLPGVRSSKLLDFMVCDWLSMVKGSDKLPFVEYERYNDTKQVKQAAKTILNREIRRNEAAVLSDGRGVFVDGEDRDKVTGLFRLYFVPLD
jgi:hypothetical protein